MPRLAGMILAACLALAACGKRGDPLPPLRREPRPVGQFEVAQRGRGIEVRFTAPTTSIDGLALHHLRVELLRAESEGPFEKTAAVQAIDVSPGESHVLTLPLPPPDTTVRLAVRAREGGHRSRLSNVTTLTTREPPPPPPAFTASQMVGGVALTWELPEILTAPEPSSSPETPATSAGGAPAGEQPAPSGESVPQPPPGETAAASQAGAPPAAPATPPAERPAPVSSAPGQVAGSATPLSATPPAGAAATPAPPAPTATPTPTPKPTPPERGVYVYRRTDPGSYEAPLTADPLMATSYVDTGATPGDEYCYVARTAVARDPLVVGEPSDEACIRVADLQPPRTPVGLSVVAVGEGFEITWSPPPAGVVAQRLLRRQGDAPPRLLAELPADVTRWVDSDAPLGRAVVYQLVAVDAAGNRSPAASTPSVTRR